MGCAGGLCNHGNSYLRNDDDEDENNENKYGDDHDNDMTMMVMRRMMMMLMRTGERTITELLTRASCFWLRNPSSLPVWSRGENPNSSLWENSQY